MESIALRYATSLFELAQETKSIDKFEEDLLLVKETLCLDNSILEFFNHYNISKEDKKKVIDQSFQDSISTYVLNFLKLLVDKKRFGNIIHIIDAFHELNNEYYGIQEGIVYSAYALTKKEIADIEKAMSKKLNVKVKLTCIVDQTLIGGVKVVIKNHVEDGSIKNKMNLLKQELLRK